MFKTSQLQISTDISEEEKYYAKKIILNFKQCSKMLEFSKEYLESIFTPFKDNPNISGEEIYKERAMFREYRDELVNNFNEFKLIAFKCVNLCRRFESDNEVLKLINSFIMIIDELEKLVNQLIENFESSKLKSNDFVKNITSKIEEIKKKISDINNLINDRIKTYFQENILASNWLDEIAEKHKIQLNKYEPIMVDIMNRKEK